MWHLSKKYMMQHCTSPCSNLNMNIICVHENVGEWTNEIGDVDVECKCQMCACERTQASVVSLGVVISVQMWMWMMSALHMRVADMEHECRSCVCECRWVNAKWSEVTVSMTDRGWGLDKRQKERKQVMNGCGWWQSGLQVNVSVSASYMKVHESSKRWQSLSKPTLS